MYVQMKIDADAIKEFKGIISETVKKVVTEVFRKEKDSNMGSGSKEELLTRKDVMAMLKISHATLYHYQMTGTIPYLKIGNRVYFKKKDIFDNPNLEGVSFGNK